jgi:hypothetical protein
MDYETLRYERDGHVTVLTYDRPEQRNAVSRQMNGELHHAWQRFRDGSETSAEPTRSSFGRKPSTRSRCSPERTRAIGARAFKEGRTPEWPHHGL